MLIVCNGAFKSGSTWLYELVNSILRVKNISLSEVPTTYSPGRSPAMKIAQEKLQQFIEDEDVKANIYLTKAHFFRLETLKAQYPDEVKFLFVERDLRDAIVSHYYHLKVYSKVNLGFKFYYWFLGRYKAYEIWLFNERCRLFFSNERFFKFEEMKTNVENTMDRLTDLLDLPKLELDEKAQVEDNSNLEALRKRASQGDNTHYHAAGKENAKLFRKGEIGGYVNYMSESQIKDSLAIENGHFGWLSKVWYFLFFELRRKITR